MVYVVNWGGFLQIYRNYPLSLLGLPLDLEQPLLAQFLPADLTPAARGPAEVYNPMGGVKDVVDIVDLKQLVGGPGAVALLLGFAIVDILN